VRSESCHRQAMISSAGLSCKREIPVLFFPSRLSKFDCVSFFKRIRGWTHFCWTSSHVSQVCFNIPFGDGSFPRVSFPPAYRNRLYGFLFSQEYEGGYTNTAGIFLRRSSMFIIRVYFGRHFIKIGQVRRKTTGHLVYLHF
jgi:hypothetical protein